MAIAKQDPQNDSEVRFEAPVADFIPYACHFDASTLLTKNGQLLQTIKIIGLSKKATNAEVSALRDGVRKSILGNITSDKFAIWIHTVRRKTNLDPGGNYNKLFTFLVHEAWCKKNYWRDKYVNELYITIVIDSESFHNNDLSNFVFQRKKHAKTLEDAYIELDEQVQKCLDDLKDYSAKKLTIGVDRKGAYSELLQFFDKIIYLREQRNSLPITDLSDHLAS